MRKRIAQWFGMVLFSTLAALSLDIIVLTSESQLKPILVRALESQLNAHVEIEATGYRLFGEVEVTGLSIFESRGAQNTDPHAVLSRVLQVERAQVRPDLFAMIRGGLPVKRISLEGAELTVIRGSDGLINLSRLAKPQPPSDEPLVLPRTVLKRFVLKYTDYSAADGSVHTVQLPPLNLSLRPIQLRGENAGSDEMTVDLTDPFLGKMLLAVRLDLKARRIEVKTKGNNNQLLLERGVYQLLTQKQQAVWNELQPKGVVVVDSLNLVYQAEPDSGDPLQYSAELRAEGCGFTYASIPQPVEQLTGTIRLRQNRLDLALTGKSGPKMVIRAIAKITGPLAGNPQIDASVSVDHIEFTKAFRETLTHPRYTDLSSERVVSVQEQVRQREAMMNRYQPSGGDNSVNVNIRRTKALPDLTAITARVRLNGASAIYENFRYPIYNLKGEIVIEEGAVTISGINGTLDPDPKLPGRCWVKGRVLGSGAKENVNIDVELSDFALDQRLTDAIVFEESRQTLRALRPKGLADASAKVLRVPGVDEKIQTVVTVTLDGRASLQPEIFAALIEDLSGTVVISGDEVEFEGVVGRYRDAEVRAEGKIRGQGESTTVAIVIEADDVLLDERFYQTLDDQTREAVKMLEPTGTIDVEARITKKADGKEMETQLTLRADGNLAVRYAQLPLPVTGVRGVVQINSTSVSFDELTGQCFSASLTATNGEFIRDAQLTESRKLNLTIQKLLFTDAVFDALPDPVRDALHSIDFAGAVSADLSIQSLAVGAPSATYVTGTVDLADVTLGTDSKIEHLNGRFTLAPKSGFDDAGKIRFWGQFASSDFDLLDQWEIKTLNSSFLLTPEGIEFGNIEARFCDGKISDSFIKASFNETADMEASFRIKGALLDKLKGKTTEPDSKKRIRGAVDGWFQIKGAGNDVTQLSGDGEMHVYDARIWELPLVFNVLDILVFKVPKSEYLEEAHAKFKIENEKFVFNAVQVMSPSLILSGDGMIDFQENLRFDMVVDIRLGLSILDPTGVLGLLKDALVPVVVEGTLSEPDAHIAPLGIGS